METTYGDRLHKPLGPSVEELYDAVADAFKRGGNVVVLTFALERAQELLYFISQSLRQQTFAKINAGLCRFSHGDLRHRDHAAPFGRLEAGHREAHS
jgi:hypothetical protein